jgi:copper transport protein
VPALRTGEASADLRRRFGRAIATELAIMALIVGVTAALIAEPPARAEAAVSVVTRDGKIGPLGYTLSVEPARAGRNDIHVYVLEPSGQPAEVDEIALTATLSDLTVGPLEIESRPAGPGHVVAVAQLPLAGSWLLRLDVRRGDFDEWSTEVPIDIGKDSP